MLTSVSPLPGVFELNKGERGSPSPVLQVDVPYRSVFVEHVLHVLGANVRREVPHVNSAVVVPRGASHDAPRHGG